MSNLVDNHNKITSSHYAQSAGNEKDLFYLINLGNKTLQEMWNTLQMYVSLIQEQLDFAQKNCSFMGRHFRALEVQKCPPMVQGLTVQCTWFVDYK